MHPRQQLLGNWCSSYRNCLEETESRLRSITEMSQELWPSQYTERKRLLTRIFNKGNIFTVLLLLLMMNLHSRKLRSTRTCISFSPFFLTFLWSISKKACSLPRRSLSEKRLKILTFLFFFLRDQLWHHQLEVSTTQPISVRRCWNKGKMKELAACMKFFRKHKSVPSVHCEQLNPFHYSKKN